MIKIKFKAILNNFFTSIVNYVIMTGKLLFSHKFNSYRIKPRLFLIYIDLMSYIDYNFYVK